MIVSSNGKMFIEQATGIKCKNNSEYHVWPFLINNNVSADKHKLTRQNLGRVFNSRYGHACVCHAMELHASYIFIYYRGRL
jgi:hypothetical protein